MDPLPAAIFAVGAPSLVILAGLVLATRFAWGSGAGRMAKALGLWLAVSLVFGMGELVWFLVLAGGLGHLDWDTQGASPSWWLTGLVLLVLHAVAMLSLVKAIRRT